MPQLTWVGKDKVKNHHHDVPFPLLNTQYRFASPADTPANSTKNRIIHGDNLDGMAQKAAEWRVFPQKSNYARPLPKFFLDAFAGCDTTTHAVLKQNAQHARLKYRYIMVSNDNAPDSTYALSEAVNIIGNL